jgi:hypothetical protein
VKIKPKVTFPNIDIYNELSIKTSDGKPSIFCGLIDPPPFKLESDDFREPNNRSEYFFGKENAQLYQNFSDRRELLIWFQRKWIYKACKEGEFKGFKPLSGQDEDNVPYDFDHLVPQSNWSSFSTSGKPNLTHTKKFNDLWPRRKLGNSIGNYRVMSASDNRSRGDAPLETELLNADASLDSLEAGFLNAKDIWDDYAFKAEENEITKWKCASPRGKPYVWNDERVLAFQYAVESRVLYLYDRYYKEIDFKSWLPDGAIQ